MALEGTLGFLGFGNMGQAIARGLLTSDTLAPERMAMFDIDPTKGEAAQAMGIAVAQTAAALAHRSTTLILAVKPQQMEEALAQIAGDLSPQVLVVSIAAGVSIGYIQSRLGKEFRVVRVMPNTPALVQAGAAALALSPNCTEADTAAARCILEAVGICEIVPEAAMDVVTALSGSGPAYFFYLVECLVKGAVEEGLAEDRALRLARQTLLGAGRLLAESGETPEALRRRVTSKGGTTEAALARLMTAGFEQIVHTAVAAAAARSRELGT